MVSLLRDQVVPVYFCLQSDHIRCLIDDLGDVYDMLKYLFLGHRHEKSG